MSRPSRLDRNHTVLAVIDMQEGFRPTMTDFVEVSTRIATAVRGASVLNVPVVITEQYPRGLKRTAAEILEAVDEVARVPVGAGAGRASVAPVIEKLAFSACGAEDFVKELGRLGAKQVLLCGIEAHICVTQTVLDLIERGFEVHLLLDCITSRHAANKQTAVARLTQAGAVPSSLEMALFELMRQAGTPEFKAVQSLIK